MIGPWVLTQPARSSPCSAKLPQRRASPKSSSGKGGAAATCYRSTFPSRRFQYGPGRPESGLRYSGRYPARAAPDPGEVPALVNAARAEAGLAPLSLPLYCKEVSATESGVVYRLESPAPLGE